MGIVSKVKDKEAKEMRFPCLMRNIKNGSVVLFSSYKDGTVVKEGRRRSCDLGHHCNYWISADNENVWEPSPPITLSNT